MRGFAFAQGNGDRFPVRSKLHVRFGNFEIDAAFGVPSDVDDSGELEGFVHEPKDFSVGERMLSVPILPRLDFVVGAFPSRIDLRFGNPHVGNLSLSVDFHKNRQAEFFSAGMERTESVRETFRKHRNDAVRQVGARSSPERFAVEGGVFPDVFRDVGDMHAEFEPSAYFFNGNRVVKVFGIGAVDGDDGFRRKVFAIRRRVVRFGEAFGLRERFGIEFQGKSAFSDENFALGIEIIGIAEALGHFSGKVLSVPFHRNGHGFAVQCPVRIAVRDVYVLTFRNGKEHETVGFPRSFPIGSKEGLGRPFEDVRDLRFGGFSVRPLDFAYGFDEIPVERSGARTVSDEEFFARRSLDESESRIALRIGTLDFSAFHGAYHRGLGAKSESRRNLETRADMGIVLAKPFLSRAFLVFRADSSSIRAERGGGNLGNPLRRFHEGLRRTDSQGSRFVLMDESQKSSARKTRKARLKFFSQNPCSVSFSRTFPVRPFRPTTKTSSTSFRGSFEASRATASSFFRNCEEGNTRLPASKSIGYPFPACAKSNRPEIRKRA